MFIKSEKVNSRNLSPLRKHKHKNKNIKPIIMEPRNYQFFSGMVRSVSPAVSEWSPIVVKNNENDNGNKGGNDMYSQSKNRLEEDDDQQCQFPAIHRSFAFDEWDNDDDYDYDDAVSRCQPDVVTSMPLFEQRNQEHNFPQSFDRYALPSLDTYMTVIALDDKKVTYTDQSLHSYLHCPSIQRHSTTYRWTTSQSYDDEWADSRDEPMCGGFTDDGHHRQNENDVPYFHSSETNGVLEESPVDSQSDHSHPIPEFIVVYKQE
jgi:hypothetical protein